MTNIFEKGIKLKIFIPIFRGSRYWFSDRFVMHMCKYCNRNNLHSTLTFEQTADLVLTYLTSNRRNSLDNMQFYELVRGVQVVDSQMNKEMNEK